MREEPVLYINGNPYVVRDADRPFANLEYTGHTSLLWETLIKYLTLSQALIEFELKIWNVVWNKMSSKK